MKYIITLSILFFSIALTAQFNLKVGYNLGYTSAEQNNNIIKAYNQANPFLEDELGELRFLNGISLGARYTLGNLALEIALDNISSSKTSSGFDPVSEAVIEQDIKYRLREYSINLQNRFDWFGYGAGIARRNTLVQSEIQSVNFQVTNINSNGYSYQFFLLFDLPSTDNLTFTLKPFVTIPFESTNISILDDILSVNTGIQEEQFTTFGLSFLFYNGRNNL